MENAGKVSQVTESISLVATLDGEWLKLPSAVMRDVGPAVQTLAGLLKVSNKETFAAVGKIATRARLKVKTTRKHLDTLEAHGWIVNAGRQKTRRGAPRRTCTLRITKKTTDALNDYAVLPWWACADVAKFRRLPWSTKAVLAVVMARLMACKAVVETMDGKGDTYPDDVFGSIENLGGERFRFTLDQLERETGLSRESVVDAKRHLKRLGIIKLYASDRYEMGTPADVLDPNPDFRTLVTSLGNGYCKVAFGGGSERG